MMKTMKEKEPVLMGCVIRIDIHETHPEFGGLRITSKDYTDFEKACEYFSAKQLNDAKSGGLVYTTMKIVFIDNTLTP